MRARLGARVLTIGGVSAAVVFGTAAVSWAHHPEVAASTDCGGVVHFTSTAWTTTSTSARTNPTIGISYSTDGGSTFAPLPQLAAYHFAADNNYSFSDTFDLSKPLPPTVIVRATALAKWANGAGAGSYRQTPALTVQACPAEPSATISDVNCSDGGTVLVRLSNDGDLPASFTLDGPAGAQQLTVDGHDSVTQTMTPTEDGDATYAVSADGMATVTKTVHRDCTQPASVATLSHDCTGIHVALANTDGTQDAVFTISTSDGVTEQVTVAAGATVTRTYAVAEGTTRTVAVTSAGMDAVSDSFTCHCSQEQPTPGNEGNTPPVDDPGPTVGTTNDGPSDPDDPSTSGQTSGRTSGSTAVLGVSEHRSLPRTTSSTPATVRSASAARQLPFTGTNTVDLLTAGLLSLILGAVLTSAGRRRGDAA
jgi:hypothetical protein